VPKGIRTLLAVVVSVSILFAATVWRSNSSPSEQSPLRPFVPGEGGPRFFKGNLHTHSLWSDGDDFPEMIADWYRNHGYHFLGLSDHNALSEGERWLDVADNSLRAEAVKKYVARFGSTWVEQQKREGKNQVRLKPLGEFRTLLETPGRFLMIQAEEITHRFARSPVHLNAINLRDVIQPSDGTSVAETMRVNLRAVADQQQRTRWRMLAFVNHPNFGWGIRAEDLLLVDELRFFEIFNGHPDVRNYGDATHAGTERIWDIVLALRLGKYGLPAVFGLATDDAHHYHTFAASKANPGRGWVMVRAPYLTAEAILRGLEAGDYYASSGVVLEDVRREGEELRLQIRPEKGVRFKTQFIATLRDTSLDSEPMTDGEGKLLPVTRRYSPAIGKVVAESEELTPKYRLTGKEIYVRARVVSSKAHPNPFRKGDVEMAWTQPLVP